MTAKETFQKPWIGAGDAIDREGNGNALKMALSDKWYRDPKEFSKKKTLAEIGVFLLISFGLMFTFGWICYRPLDLWEKQNGWQNFCYYMAAFSPAVGCIAARYIFREGFRDDILFPKFTGNFKGYLLSILLPIVFGIMNCVLITVALGAGFTLKGDTSQLEVAAQIALYSSNAYMAFFLLIGEELGWRAFLYDKLEMLFGLHGSIVMGGIIWGLWHIPALINMGLNFGKDAPGFPVTNILLMCIFCTGCGAVMQMLRKMTDSVVAPTIAHAIIDTVCNVLAIIFLSEELVAGKQFRMGCCLLVSALIMGIPCWIYMARKYATGSER